MIRVKVITPPAFTEKGNAKNVQKAKAAYEQIGWTVLEEFVGSLSYPSYLVVEAEPGLMHPKRPIIQDIKEADFETVKEDPRLTEIQGQITEIGSAHTYLVKKEICSLPEILSDEEVVLGLVVGIMDGDSWLSICTAKRVVMIDKGMFGGTRQKEVQIGDIKSIEMQLGMLEGIIKIQVSSSSLEIKKAANDDVKKFVAAVKAAMEQSQKIETATDANNDVVSKLSRLGDLMTKGLISEEEFSAAKAKVLRE